MARAYFPLFFDQYISLVTNLDDEEAGRLFRAMLYYAREGLELSLSGKEMVVWPLIQRDIDHSRQAYERRCAINAANGKLGGRGHKAEESDRFLSQAEETQSEKAEKAYQSEKADQSLKTEQTNQSNQPNLQKQGKEEPKAGEAGGVERVQGRGPNGMLLSDMSFEERKKYYMGLLCDDYIREQRELQGRPDLNRPV